MLHTMLLLSLICVKLTCIKFTLLQLELLDQRQQLCVILDNTQLPYLEAYSALFVL